ncbi:Glycosyl transferase family 11 [Rubripirellula amarantea]|uniref:Glycosyl transferase family 11 n=1 Tax=Rubripirellula amarantea TaxID=2527999 RepID=A0A5C5WV74_9BACT|nr:alpha-1,2-fucosyltransferase [Rubripirellula amarantea]TWT53732.1 Glycosyl transferase family 11 [Rubripirellula amarantea]
MIVIARNYGQLGNRLVLAANLIAAAQEYNISLVNPSFTKYAKYFCSTEHDLWCRFDPKPNPQSLVSGLPIPPLPTANDYEVLSFRMTYPIADYRASRASDEATFRKEGNASTTEPSALSRELLYRAVYLTGRSLSHLRMTRFPFHVVRLVDEDECDLTSDSFAAMAQSKRPTLVAGWRFLAGPWLTKHADIIRKHFRITPPHESNVESLMAGIRRNSQTVIGIHIRQGDYATFRDGMYYYSVADYVAAMRRVQNELRGQAVSFLVCGNSDLHRNDFSGLDVHFGTGHMVEDMYAFAKCDQLIGPPSSFTGWASFYGDVPLHRMHTAQESFDQLLHRPRLTHEQTLEAA